MLFAVCVSTVLWALGFWVSVDRYKRHTCREGVSVQEAVLAVQQNATIEVYFL